MHLLHQELLQSFKVSLKGSNAEYLQGTQNAKENYEFFAHMSHELRTPFHGVMSSLEILQNGGDQILLDERNEILSSALECGKNMVNTLNDILDVSKRSNST
jgi:signal transduction histidine kinase